MKKTASGLDNLLANPGHYLKGKNLGLVVNQTSVTGSGQSSISLFQQQKAFEVKKLFAPEHGLYGVAQDMEGVAHEKDPGSGLPVQSLYGSDPQSLIPDPAEFAGLDAIVFDIQDIGSRYYTFIYTLANCMQTCKEAGVPIVVCDRPNPINGAQVEGNLVRERWRSFVGQYPIPNRHGMTVGELAGLFNDHFEIGCGLTVVKMDGWDRNMWFGDTGLPWVPPSPNMPTLNTATVYPGMCLVEGTQLSEGRGTTLPFELCGAPGIDAHKLAEALNKENLPGIHFRPQYFKPKFQKHADTICGGVQLHITDRTAFKSLLTGISVIRTIARLFPEQFEWRKDAYEFVTDRPAIDLLYGHPELREKFMGPARSLGDIESSWREDLDKFLPLRKKFLIY